MDILDALSVRKFKEFNAQQREELYETILQLGEAIEELPQKSLRKTLEIFFLVLQYKGKQVESLKFQLEQVSQDESQDAENNKRRVRADGDAKWRQRLEKLENEKRLLKTKNKQLNEEISQLQERLQTATQSGELSDKDSSDPLSELDKQEELLRNINMKNKHIKRLLKEIETLQTQNIAQSKTIIEIEKELQLNKARILQMSEDIITVDEERKALKEEVNNLQIEITRLEGNINFLEDERERSEKDLKAFIEKLEAKNKSLKSKLDEKDNELRKLRSITTNNDNMGSNKNGESVSQSIGEATKSDDDTAESMRETTKLMHAIETRDRHIEQLEEKLKNMATEMLASTQIMNKISAEKEEARDPQKPRNCCKLIEKSLHAANERCRELSEMLDRSEEDNQLKSKQAMQALTTLEAYQRGEDGLVQTLKKCNGLEQKLAAREKQIRALTAELNSMHEIAYENSMLRKRLNIGDDVVITTKNVTAKERNKEKIIERLNLKLRASEEMRLQLKLEKIDLRREVLQLQKQVQKSAIETEPEEQESTEMSLRLPSEVGEVQDSMSVNAPARISGITYNVEPAQNEDDFQSKYAEIYEENETLRQGMFEILEKLRDYNATSDHITIDSELLLRVLQSLKTRASADSPNYLQTELQILRERETALRKQINQLPTLNESESDDIPSIQNVRDTSMTNAENSIVNDENNIVDSSTRPTTPNENLTQSLVPIIAEVQSTEELRALRQEVDQLKVYRKHFEELKIHMAASEVELTRHCTDLVQQVSNLELELTKLHNSYNFMREDYDRAQTVAKQNELRHIQNVADLQRELNSQRQEILWLEAQCGQYRNCCNYHEDEFHALRKTNAELQAQVAHIVNQILAGKLGQQFQIKDICTDYGIISENLQLEYITVEEYNKHRTELMSAIKQQDELYRKTKQLEGLLEIAQNQIHSQQKLLNEITDNHINLRHLVADLQSTSEDKLLLAKIQREYESAKIEINYLKSERDELKRKEDNLRVDLHTKQQKLVQQNEDFQLERKMHNIKTRFLQKSLYTLKEKYSKFTPLIFLTNFIFAYTKFIKKSLQNSVNEFSNDSIEQVKEFVLNKLKQGYQEMNQSEGLIKLIKTETQCKLLEENLANLQRSYESLQKELAELRMRCASETEHWQTIEALFAPTITQDNLRTSDEIISIESTPKAPIPAQRKSIITNVDETNNKELVDKNNSPIASPAKQNLKEMHEMGMQTELEKEEIKSPAIVEEKAKVASKVYKDQAVQTTTVEDEQKNYEIIENSTMENQLKAAQERVTSNEKQLQKTQQQLSAAQKHIAELEQHLETAKNSESMAQEKQSLLQENQDTNQQAGVIEKTIMSFHTLLTEKDKSISKYQDLLQSERDQSQSVIVKLNTENESLKLTVGNLNYNIKSKDLEIMDLKTKIETMHLRRRSREKNIVVKAAASSATLADDSGSDNSLNELTDEKIEEMFQEDPLPISLSADHTSKLSNNKKDVHHEEKHEQETLKELPPTLLKQLKELKDKCSYWERQLKMKDDEIALLKEKLNHCKEREKSVETVNNNSPEIEQLRLLMDEKDKHIADLMNTLKSFHDDQERFMTDSTDYSADQIAKLAGDLTRTEATNRIYQAQVEALRRQVASLTQREKQARELNQTLRNQLIKRPVVSIKTELNSRVKTESLQKRNQQLELDLEEARAQIQRQQVLLDTKRAKSSSEVNLWEKQKRWQQNAEKYKAKLEETEAALEKTRNLLQTARNTISRMEKEKQMMKLNLGRATQSASTHSSRVHNLQSIHNPHTMKCCRAPSCPNLTQVCGKFTPSDTPETCTGPSSESSSPIHSREMHYTTPHPQDDLIEALKARIELQQRKILAMELEGKGTNVLTTEIEKLQERFSAIEAQNIRLEARNLQLQLDNDMLRQGDGTERLQKRIKHLEDYIIALKEEMAQQEAKRILCKCTGLKIATQQGHPAEQTILSLRSIVEKLRAENKYLKEARKANEARGAIDTNTDLPRLQQMYTEAMDKVSALQVELELKTKCPHCNNRGKLESGCSNDELKFIKEQLIKKTQLLQKAKVLLTRAAAKEKVLKEQLALWKRKCSELQNVPVIEEISE